MSERMTSIRLPGTGGPGWAEYGRKTRAEMIAILRKHAERDKAVAEAILDAADEDFEVATYIGKIVERKRELVTE